MYFPLNFLKNEGDRPGILKEVEQFQAENSLEDRLQHRIPVPRYLYYDKDIREKTFTALISGEKLLIAAILPGSGIWSSLPIQRGLSFRIRSPVFD